MAANKAYYIKKIRRLTFYMDYRKLAFDTYPSVCAYCGFGIQDVLEVAHLDGDRKNNAIDNLVVLCPNCHKMHDINLIPTEIIIEMRDHRKNVDWKKRLKDAAVKAALTRKRSRAGKKAAATRAKRSARNIDEK
jgi:predicted restriction endonuclease